jgi:hypothetical protein
MDSLQKRKTRIQCKLISLQERIRLQVRSERLKLHPNKGIFANLLIANHEFEKVKENLKISKVKSFFISLKFFFFENKTFLDKFSICQNPTINLKNLIFTIC